MARPPRAGETATYNLQIRLTAEELETLDAERHEGEARADTARRLLALDQLRAGKAKRVLLRSALIRMGYHPEDVARAVEKIGAMDLSLPDMMREAVRYLGAARYF